MNENEAVLLRRFIRTGDAEAFAEITRLYAGMVYGVCLRVTRDAEHARDATQDTFFQLLKSAGQISGSLGGWLHQVATRRAVDLIRRDSARRQREQTFATDTLPETDAWSDVSPLVDEAMNEISAEQRDLLLRHFLQGETTIQLAATAGVSQPTMSRRVAAALEQLRQRLRGKGIGVSAATLAALMGGAASSAPTAVLAELGKIALVSSGTAAASAATTTALGLNVKLAVAAAVAVVGVGGYLAYRATRSVESPPPTLAAAQPAVPPVESGEPGAPLADSQVAVTLTPPPDTPVATSRAAAGPALMGGVAPPQGFGGGAPLGGGAIAGAMPMGGMGYGGYSSEPPPTRATPEGALTLFANALVRGDPARWLDCFDGTVESNPVRRALEDPTTDAESEWQKILKSLRPPVELVATTATEDGLKVKWKAIVLQPFTTTETGVSRTWQRGDRFELEVRLKEIRGEWKIVGF